MISLSASQFDQKAIFHGDSEIVFEGKIYTKGPSCSTRLKEIAFRYCKLHENQNLLTLLVEDFDVLTIWLQKAVYSEVIPKPRSKTIVHTRDLKSSSSSQMVHMQPSSLTKRVETASTNSTPKTEKIVRKYRGRTYEKEMLIVETRQSNLQKIYRGKRY